MTEHRKARLAVVGLGKMGIMHTAMTRACPRAELVALVDRDPKLVGHVGSWGPRQEKPPLPGFADLGEMIAQVKPDGIILATPQFTHRALAEQALAAGVGVLTEKPLAHNIEDAEKFAATACSSKAPVSVGFMKGHDDWYLLGAALAGGDNASRWIYGSGGQLEPRPAFLKDATWPASPLGRVAGFRAAVSLGQVFKEPKGWTFTKEKAGGGVLINTGIHLLFLLRLWFGELVSVQAKMASTHSPETEDVMMALATYRAANGAEVSGTVYISWSVPECATEATEIMVEGTEGWLWFEDHAARLWLRKKAEGSWWRPLETGWTSLERKDLPGRATLNASPEYGGEGYANEVDDFARALLTGTSCRFTAEHGLQVQRDVDAYYRAAAAP